MKTGRRPTTTMLDELEPAVNKWFNDRQIEIFHELGVRLIVAEALLEEQNKSVQYLVEIKPQG
jgi:hypothetical protein